MKRILFVFNHPAFYKVRLLNELSKYFEIDVIFERRKNKDRNKFFYSESNYKLNLISITTHPTLSLLWLNNFCFYPLLHLLS